MKLSCIFHRLWLQISTGNLQLFFLFGKFPVLVPADYNSKCLPSYYRVSWPTEYGARARHMIKASRKHKEIIADKVYKEKKFWVSWLLILETTPGVYVLYIEDWVILLSTAMIRVFWMRMLIQLLIRNWCEQADY